MKRCIFCLHSLSHHVLKTDTRLNDVMWCHNVNSPRYEEKVIAGKDTCDCFVELEEQYYKYRKDVAYNDLEKAAKEMVEQDILFALNIIAYALISHGYNPQLRIYPGASAILEKRIMEVVSSNEPIQQEEVKK